MQDFSTTMITGMYEYALCKMGDWKSQGVQRSKLQQEKRLKGVECNKNTAQIGGDTGSCRECKDHN